MLRAPASRALFATRPRLESDAEGQGFRPGPQVVSRVYIAPGLTDEEAVLVLVKAVTQAPQVVRTSVAASAAHYQDCQFSRMSQALPLIRWMLCQRR